MDPRKQKLARQHHETLQAVTDDFDQLTNQVKVRKLKEYIQKRNEEIKKTQLNDKKNQSTAYRPTNMPKPMQTPNKGEEPDLTAPLTQGTADPPKPFESDGDDDQIKPESEVKDDSTKEKPLEMEID